MSSVEQIFKVVSLTTLEQAAYLDAGTGNIAYALASGPYCETVEPRITAAFTDAGVSAIGEAHGTGNVVAHRFTCIPQETGDPFDDLVVCGTYRQLASHHILASASLSELPYILAGTRLAVIRRVTEISLPELVVPHAGLYMPETLIAKLS